jgi:hypothetical protein
MKKLNSVLFSSLISLALTATLSAEPANVQVDFVRLENFTDSESRDVRKMCPQGYFATRFQLIFRPLSPSGFRETA